MGKKYHINGKGIPAICKAAKGKCPFGGSDSHYKKIEDAQVIADMQNELNHGLIVSEYTIAKEAKTENDLKYVNLRMDAFRQSEVIDNRKHYYSRSKSSEKLKDYVPNDNETIHWQKERKARDDIIIEQFGKGEVIGHYKVNHEIKGKFQEQIIEIYDTGQIKLYDVNDGSIVTTFIPTKQRMEIMMLRAGDIPNNQWLNKVQKNKEIFDEEWEKVAHKYDKKNRRSKPKFFSEKEKQKNVSRNKVNTTQSENDNSKGSQNNTSGRNNNNSRKNNNFKRNNNTRKNTNTNAINNNTKNATNTNNNSNAINNENKKKQSTSQKPQTKEIKYNKHGIPINA